MSWLFKHGKTKLYRQVTQMDSDESFSDDEDVIFKQPGDLELQLVPTDTSGHQPKRKHRPKQDVVLNKHHYRVTVALALLLVMVTSLIVGLVVVKHLYGTPIEVHGGNGTHSTTSPATDKSPASDGDFHTNDEVSLFEQTPNWSFSFDDFAAESCVRLLDVDGDGREDILFGVANASLLDRVLEFESSNLIYSSLADFCHSEGLEYPCVGFILAVRGYDGKLLYRLPIRSEVFLLNCDEIDVNKDDRVDCIGTGRQGVAVAFDPYVGRVLWSAEDDQYLQCNWNIYQAVALPDWDQDGVPEILLANGGNPKAKPTDHERESGRLVVVSGATGQVLGERYLAMPHSKETYVTPVLYQPPEGSPYILFGSGGETVKGDFMGISVVDFCHYIMGSLSASVCPSQETDLYWPSLRTLRDDIGVFVLYRGESKGVMVPPVIVDVDGDGTDDIVMSAYEGRVILYSGRTLDPIWTAEFPGMESYSSPAPGYFDDDDILDFMVHWCVGAWPRYTSSNVTILSGKNGSVLWTLESANCQMTSDLVVQTGHMHRDMFLFRLKGRNSRLRFNSDGTITRLDDQRRRRRHGGDEMEPKPNTVAIVNGSLVESLRQDYHLYHVTCEDDLSSYQGEVFLMDRTNQHRPYRVLTLPSSRYHYNATYSVDDPPVSDAPAGQGNMGSDATDTGETQMCSVMSADDRSTGAIGDVDGDGSLDFISIHVAQVSLFDSGYSYWKTKYVVTLDKVNLQPRDLDAQFQSIPIQASTAVVDHPDNSIDKTTAQSAAYADTILPPRHQLWTQYMGRHGNSIYKKGV